MADGCLNLDTLRFRAPFEGGGLRSTYSIHRFIGRRVVDFLLMLIELFSLAVTAEALQGNIKLEQSHGLSATASVLHY